MKPNIHGIALLLSKAKPAAEPDAAPEEDGSEYEDAGKDIMDAIDAKDPKALADSICDLFDIHASKNEPSSDDASDTESTPE